MFENITTFFKKWNKKEKKAVANSKEAAKERLHLVLMQDRANVSADFLELMKQEIIEVIKKYIDVDENAIDVRLTNKENGDGTNGAPALYANIPILNIKNEARQVEGKQEVEEKKEKSEKVEKKTEKVEKKTEKESKKVEKKKAEKKEKPEKAKKETEPKEKAESKKEKKNKQEKNSEKQEENKEEEKAKEKIKSEN